MSNVGRDIDYAILWAEGIVAEAKDDHLLLVLDILGTDPKAYGVVWPEPPVEVSVKDTNVVAMQLPMADRRRPEAKRHSAHSPKWGAMEKCLQGYKPERLGKD